MLEVTQKMLRCASFNVLADAYIGYGDYSNVDSKLLQPGARLPGLLKLIDALDVDVIGLQEVEGSLVQALNDTDSWQTFWSPKRRNKLDGCLTLVSPSIDVGDFQTHHYRDESGGVMQTIRIGQVIFANTHIKWAPEDDPEHIGVSQTHELLEQVGPDGPAVIVADCNDQLNGPVRQLIHEAGFTSICSDAATALVNQEPVALDLIAVRGVQATTIDTGYYPLDIPNRNCPSDHIPILANLAIG